MICEQILDDKSQVNSPNKVYVNRRYNNKSIFAARIVSLIYVVVKSRALVPTGH